MKMPLCPTCKSLTGFVRHHPFKDGYEVRKCFKCNTSSAHASDGSTDTTTRRKK